MKTAAVDEAYLSDSSGYKGWAERICVPADEREVLDVLREASEQKMPITVAGAGSGLTGSRVPQGGWVLSLEKFRKLEIGQGSARVGPAVTLMEIRDAAARTNQFYAPDPTEITASIGGTIATNASGSRSFRYGSTRRHILALRIALLDGRIVEYRRGDKIDFPVPPIPLPKTTKCTAGYHLEPGMDWIDLFCGSEGTLGVILEAELALLPIPADLFTAVVFFASDEQALSAVDAWRPVPELRMMEYFDRNSLALLRGRFPDIPANGAAALLIESESTAVDTSAIDIWETRLTEADALTDVSWFAVTAKDRERFRSFRHALPELVIATVRQRGYLKLGTDYAVPIHQNREMLAYYRRRLDVELPGHYVIYGHIGDAHVHVNMLPASQEEADTASVLLKEFAKKAVERGGTVSAEHGLGKRKAAMLAWQYEPQSVQAMKDVKLRLDPHWLLGRGTIFEMLD
jgi:FAD/FMN-containing dehydrogenase